MLALRQYVLQKLEYFLYVAGVSGQGKCDIGIFGSGAKHSLQGFPEESWQQFTDKKLFNIAGSIME